MAKPRVLVVDDDRSLLTALKSALHLRMKDVSVETVESGDEAIEQLGVSEFDVIVTDIKMPGMDGLTLLKEIRTLDPDLPTLLITGHGQHDLAVQALRGGAFDFIQKPLDRDYLVAALRRAIQVRRQHKTILSQKSQLENHAAELEMTVHERTRNLRELNHAKDQFLAMLAHELRNPLACIRHSIDLLDVTEAQQPRQIELFDLISHQVSHMTHLLDDLLDVSRISRNEITLRKTSVELSRVLNKAVEAVQPMIAEMEHTLIVELPDQQIIVNGDESRLEQIFVNLLHNAAKYTNPGGQIRVALEFSGNEAVVEVQDNGIGIAPEMLQTVFKLFSQVDRSLDRSRGGLGIGLTLVEKLVTLHGGDITAHSDGDGRGCTFALRIPAVQSSQPVTPDEPDQRPRLNHYRIVLVEDNQTLAKLTSDLLRDCGQEVVAVISDGHSAIDAACTHRPDFMFLDIGIPELDGYEVARRLRQTEQLNELKIVALTGYGTEQDRQRSKAAGIDYHLTKPVSWEALSELLSPASQGQPGMTHQQSVAGEMPPGS